MNRFHSLPNHSEIIRVATPIESETAPLRGRRERSPAVPFNALVAEVRYDYAELERRAAVAGAMSIDDPDMKAAAAAMDAACDRFLASVAAVIDYPAPSWISVIEKMRLGLLIDPDGGSCGTSDRREWQVITWLRAALADLERLADEPDPEVS